VADLQNNSDLIIPVATLVDENASRFKCKPFYLSVAILILAEAFVISVSVSIWVFASKDTSAI
jgi:hypothetical protein